MHSLLPKELLSSLEGVKGYDAEAFERVHADGGQVTSIRLNPGKPTIGNTGGDGVPAAMMGAEKVPWSSFGFYLPQRPSFTFDPLFHAGVYYVQEASSMYLEQALRQTMDLTKPLRVLDLCAAPGGKSTLIESLLPVGSLLVTNEVIRTRVSILQENMVKWGGPAVAITSNDPRDLGRMENYFDVIVVDAPCSGSGLFRREPDAIREWSPESVQSCAQRQQRILTDCWPALRPGGVLLYSTCSYSTAEDEEILDWMMEELDATPCRLTNDVSWNIVETESGKGGFGYRFFPDRLKGEGFYMSAVRKNDGGNFSYPKSKKNSIEKLSRTEEPSARSWVESEAPLYFFRHNEFIHAWPEALRDDLGYLQSMSYLKKTGITMGKLAGNDLIPEHDLALSRILRKDLHAVDLSGDDAIRYLRKDELRIEDAKKGWALARYEGQHLGWVKILPNRVNNYYPKELRILKREP